MRRTHTALFLATLCAAVPAQAQETPLREAEIIRQLTAEGPIEWLNGVTGSLGVAPEERTESLLAAMIRGLEREVEWSRTRTGPNDPSFGYEGEAFGESSAILARELAATRDPRILPALAWHAYNGGPVAEELFRFGHEAVPHLLEIAMSPDASGSYARGPLAVLASIVSVHGPGSHERELADAAALHLDGPPDRYLSRWSNHNDIISLPEAIALAGALRTPELLERLKALASSPPERIAQMTGHSYMAEWVSECARAVLDRTDPPIAFCDPMWWAKAADRSR